MNKEAFRPTGYVEGKSPEKHEKEPNLRGVQNFAVSTAAFLFDPEEGFEILNELNDRRVQADKNRVGIEIYPTHYPPIIEQHLPPQLVEFLEKRFPPHLSDEDINESLKNNKGVPLHGFHDAFNFNLREEITRATAGELVLPEVPEGNMADRLLLGIKNRRDQTAWIFFFGQARNRHTVEIAQQFASEYPELNLIFHANVAHGFAQSEELKGIKNGVPHVLAESERPYRFSPPMQPISRETGIPAWRLVSEPELVMEHTAVPLGLGMVLDADHALARGGNPLSTLEAIKERVREVHLAGSGGTTLHEKIDLENPKVNEFLNQLLSSNHPHPWTLTIDINPLVMEEFDTKEKKIGYFEKLFVGIENMQAETLGQLQ